MTDANGCSHIESNIVEACVAPANWGTSSPTTSGGGDNSGLASKTGFYATNSYLEIRPNVFKNNLNLSYYLVSQEPDSSVPVSIRLIATSGQFQKELLNKEVENNQKHYSPFDATNLPAGLYFIVLETPDLKIIEKGIKF